MGKKSFILYGSYAEQFEKLDDESAGQLIKAVFAYVNNKEIPEIKNNGADMAFSFICSQIDRDQKYYDKRCETNRINAKLGGRPKKEKQDDLPKKDSELGENAEPEMPASDPESMQSAKQVPKKRRNEYPKEFEEFWNNYPRHEAKGDCYEKYQARCNDGYTPEELLTAAKNYRDWTLQTNREKKYIKCGKTFLSDKMPFLDFIEIGGDIKEMAEKSQTKKNKFNNFKQREYDYDELERKIYGAEQ